MKREIKFRAFNKKSKQIKYVLDGIDFAQEMIYCNDSIQWLIEDCILMQYIGLKDKNGKEIYEGDIIEYNNLFDKERIKQIIKNMTEWLIEYGYEYEEMCSYRNIIVLGNIYENPELMWEK